MNTVTDIGNNLASGDLADAGLKQVGLFIDCKVWIVKAKLF